MEILIALVIYAVGFVITTRTLSYVVKRSNESVELELEGGTIRRLGPRLYSRDDYEALADELGVSRKTMPSSDNARILGRAVVWPAYWPYRILAAFFGALLFDTSHKTPLEKEIEERERQEYIDELLKETEEMRREQDGQ